MTTIANNDSPISFRASALAFSPQKVTAMIKKLTDSLDRREVFESANNVTGEANSWSRASKNMRKASNAVARFFLALQIEPANVIERQVVQNAMFNAKALDKVTELALYSCGIGNRLQKVTSAFIACALYATDKSIDVITNEVNRRFLCSSGFTAYIADQELIDHLIDKRHAAMTSGAETQSSQARNVLDVLGLGDIVTSVRARDAIKLHADHEFYAQFRTDYMKDAVAVTVDA